MNSPNLLKFICNTKISTPGLAMVVGRHVQSGEKFELPKAHILTEVEQDHYLPPFSSHAVNSILFMVYLYLIPVFHSLSVFGDEILLILGMRFCSFV